MRIDYGPGYRVYYLQRGLLLIVLLCGGDKSTQARDIARATGLTREGLYKALSGEGNPSFATVMKVARALGLKLTFRSA